MNKLLLIGLIFLAACQSTPLGPSLTPTSIPTHITPSPVPPTATATGINTQAPSPTPIPPERYFTEEFDKPLTHWSTLFSSGDSSHVEVRNKNSELTFELNSTNTWGYVIYGAFEYESVHIETKIDNIGSDVNAAGLICHYDEQDGWYEFNISSDGTYSILHGQWLADGIARYTPILNDISERIELGNAANQIGLDCYDNILQLYINDKLIRKMDVTHVGLTGGKIGFAIASFDELPVILSFDWVKVREP